MSGILEHHSRSGRRRRLQLALLLLLTCLLAIAMPPAAADTGPSVRDSVWAFRSAKAQQLWAVSKGAGVKVAVVDSGVDASHPDLQGRIYGAGDFGDGSTANGSHDIGGQRGHGTEMAGVIAATGLNYRRHGIAGLAPEARILSYGVYENSVPNPDAVAKAVRAAVAKGAEIIVMPPVEPGHPDVASAVRHAIARNVVVISGTGAGTQRGTSKPVDPQAPPATGTAVIPGVLTVAAVDQQGQVWPTRAGGRHVVVAAPGAGILGAASDGTYWTGSDAGFAAAWVAGVAALLRSKHQSWTAAQTIQKILDTAHSNGSGCGPQDCGYGVVNALRAVTDMSTPTTRANPLLNAPATRHPAVESPFMGVPPERILLFVVSSLAALVLYVAVTGLFIWRARGRGGRFDGTVS